MKILMVNTTDIEGGAARAAYRLHTGLNSVRINSQMLVQRKISDDSSVINPGNIYINKIRPKLDKIPLKVYRKRKKSYWGVSLLPRRADKFILAQKPSIVHLHWIGDGFIPVSSLKRLDKPVVWTLHDMWAFTGGCHYTGDCEKYLQSCGLCPQLGSNFQNDLSRLIWKHKQKAWEKLNLTVVTPSNWLADCARSSSLLKSKPVKVIPNGIDINHYRPVEKEIARELLKLPLDKKLVLFGAMNAAGDPRKGFEYLQLALNYLAENSAVKPELVIFGSSQPENPSDLGLRANYLGRLYDDVTLVLLYSAADVFVAPSVQENLANTVMEALACGTPCVAFNIGGMPDMIEHQRNGYLARPFEADDLARGIAWVLEDKNRREILSHRAREKVVQEFDIKLIAGKYLELYQDILNRKQDGR